MFTGNELTLAGSRSIEEQAHDRIGKLPFAFDEWQQTFAIDNANIEDLYDFVIHEEDDLAVIEWVQSRIENL